MRREDRAGLEFTIIFHLVVLIILLLCGLGYELQGENSFVLDFSKEEKAQRQQQQEQLREEVNRNIDEIIAERNRTDPIRNVAVSSKLRDDRHSQADADKLYSDAEALSRNLKAGYKSDVQEDARDEAVDCRPEARKQPKAEYSGPSVLSWTLDSRKASHLPIPAYRCYGAGEVTVTIVVDQQGNVVKAVVNEAVSSADKCLLGFAIRAARLSKFNRDSSAPVRQVGEIVYAFIAQQ